MPTVASTTDWECAQKAALKKLADQIEDVMNRNTSGVGDFHLQNDNVIVLMKSLLNRSIEITEGLGHLKFGFTTADVERDLGSPNETETFHSETDSPVMWYYANQKLQIIFQSSVCGSAAATGEVKRITQFTTSHPATTLWGKKMIGLRENEVLALFAERGYHGFVEWDDSLKIPGYKSLRMQDIRVTLAFQDGVLECVLWGSLNN